MSRKSAGSAAARGCNSNTDRYVRKQRELLQLPICNLATLSVDSLIKISFHLGPWLLSSYLRAANPALSRARQPTPANSGIGLASGA